jgi:hypothetical protein
MTVLDFVAWSIICIGYGAFFMRLWVNFPRRKR